MADETKRLTPEAGREIAGRVNPQYSDTPGTESHERALLLSEIQALRRERDTARGAVKELEAKVFSQEQALDVLRTCVARHQRDEADPPGYLQDAVIRAAGLGVLHTERDAAIKERGEELRARLAAMDRQGPVLLTDAGIAEAFLSCCPAHLRGAHDVRDMQARPDVIELGKAIETAVLAANGWDAAR